MHIFPDASEESPVYLLCECGEELTLTAPPQDWPIPCPVCRRPVRTVHPRTVGSDADPDANSPRLLPGSPGGNVPEVRPSGLPARAEGAGLPDPGGRQFVELTQRTFTGKLVSERVEVKSPETWSTETLALALWLAASLTVVVGHALITDEEFSAGSIFARSLLFAIVTAGFVAFQGRVVRPTLAAPRSPRIWLTIGFLGVPASVGLVLIYFKALGAFGEEELTDPLGRLMSDRGESLPLLIVAVGILPGIFEELGFRGWMQSTWRLVASPGRALVLTACSFAVIHFSLASLGWLLPMGLYLGWLREGSGSIWPGVVAHAGHNTAMVLLSRYG